MSDLHVSEHPLAHALLDELRNVDTRPSRVRMLVSQLAFYLILEASKTLPVRRKRIQTPVAETEGIELESCPVGVPVLRAGLGMLPTFLQVFPNAQVGFLGIHRNEETLEPVAYYERLPQDLHSRWVFVLDPMLATGGTAAASIQHLRKYGAEKIALLSLVGAPEGVRKVQQTDERVDIYLVALDERLNDKGYIVPGLGDAGDRLFPVNGWPEVV